MQRGSDGKYVSQGMTPCHIWSLDRVRMEERTGGQLTLRLEVLCELGGTCRWPGCGITDTDMLEVAHVLGNGAEERRMFARGYFGLANTMGKVQQYPQKSDAYYKNIIARASSGEYAVYCANHHRKVDALHRREKRLAAKRGTLR